MPKIKAWEFETFPVGDIESQRISFSIDDHDFFMIFTPLIEDYEYIQDRALTAGFSIPDRSYDVKFDRAENFITGNFYSPPHKTFTPMTPGKMKRLGLGIYQIINFHCTVSGAQVYFASAENRGLKKFYDRLAKRYADQLNYQVLTDLGDEGLDYAIKTSKFIR